MVQLKQLLFNKMSTWRLFRLKKTWTINSKTKYTKTITVPVQILTTHQELGNHQLMHRAKNQMRLRFRHIIAQILLRAMMLSLQMWILRVLLVGLQRPITMHLRSLLQTQNNSLKFPSKTWNPPIGKRISMPWILSRESLCSINQCSRCLKTQYQQRTVLKAWSSKSIT